MSIEDQITIEGILEEASAFGLRWEVQEWANVFIEEGVDVVDAYNQAFEEWIK
jgi:hypothetical protein